MKIKTQTINQELFDHMSYMIFIGYTKQTIIELFGLDIVEQISNGYWRHVVKMDNEN
jgi:hypothetical protein